MYRLGPNEILRICVLEHEISMILIEAYDCVGGHYAGKDTTWKILREILWCPSLHKDAREYCRSCDVFQIVGKPSRRDEMPLVP